MYICVFQHDELVQGYLYPYVSFLDLYTAPGTCRGAHTAWVLVVFVPMIRRPTLRSYRASPKTRLTAPHEGDFALVLVATASDRGTRQAEYVSKRVLDPRHVCTRV